MAPRMLAAAAISSNANAAAKTHQNLLARVIGAELVENFPTGAGHMRINERNYASGGAAASANVFGDGSLID